MQLLALLSDLALACLCLFLDLRTDLSTLCTAASRPQGPRVPVFFVSSLALTKQPAIHLVLIVLAYERVTSEGPFRLLASTQYTSLHRVLSGFPKRGLCYRTHRCVQFGI